MKHAGNIFEQEGCRGTGTGSMSDVTLTMIICSVLSGLAAINIIVNFGAITARIAIFVANLLSSGLLILIAAAVFIYFIMRLKWRLRRSFWGW